MTQLDIMMHYLKTDLIRDILLVILLSQQGEAFLLTVGHRAAKGGRQKGIGKKEPQTRKMLPKSDRKREKGHQKVSKKESEWPTLFCLPPFAGP